MGKEFCRIDMDEFEVFKKHLTSVIPSMRADMLQMCAERINVPHRVRLRIFDGIDVDDSSLPPNSKRWAEWKRKMGKMGGKSFSMPLYYAGTFADESRWFQAAYDNGDGTITYKAYPPRACDEMFNRRSMRGYRNIFGLKDEEEDEIGDAAVKVVEEKLDGVGL